AGALTVSPSKGPIPSGAAEGGFSLLPPGKGGAQRRMTTAWMQEVELRMEQSPRVRAKRSVSGSFQVWNTCFARTLTPTPLPMGEGLLNADCRKGQAL